MNFTKKDKSILIGLAIGDGYVGKDHNSTVIKIVHCAKQKEYCTFKAKLLHSVFGGNAVKVYDRLATYHVFINGDKIKKQAPTAWIQKKSIHCDWLRTLLYPEGKKKLTRKALDFLDPLSIAIWWLDDGNVDFHESGNGTMCATLRWNMYSTKEEALVAQTYFKEVWNVQWNVVMPDRKRSPDKYNLHCGKKEGEKFLSIIRDIVREKVPSMSYKVVDLDHEIRARINARRDSLNLQDDKLQELGDKEPLG